MANFNSKIINLAIFLRQWYASPNERTLGARPERVKPRSPDRRESSVEEAFRVALDGVMGNAKEDGMMHKFVEHVAMMEQAEKGISSWRE